MDRALETTNIDKNISPLFYKGRDQLLVRSIFNTIQGEMPFAGYPATFLRLGGCNRGAKVDIGCEGCDTDFAVDKSIWTDIDALTEQVIVHLLQDRKYPRLLVITGGEPLLQYTNLLKLFDKLDEAYTVVVQGSGRPLGSIQVQFETNGDYLPTGSFHPFITKCYVISPKSPFKKRPWWMGGNNTFERYIRRVVSGDPQSNYYNVPEEILAARRWAKQVYLSPQTHYLPGASQSEGESRHAINWELTDLAIKRAIELANQHNLIVSAQWHAYANIR